MARDTHSVGLAFLLSALIVAGVATSCRLLFAPVSALSTASDCQQHYTVACLM
ncbi:MAG: hypothetical protein PHX87_06075 [Candidatus Peribacteraceae bacterium]|nr:hypothetical protein [Candidatus Peribacteraceae bacterium]MDD5742957.1 hypothetical protein [Candidatus Peribacteraceae bacterium]